MKKLINKILFYKCMTIEVLETLQTICFVISQSRNPPTQYRSILMSHADFLHGYASAMRRDMAKTKRGQKSEEN